MSARGVVLSLGLLVAVGSPCLAQPAHLLKDIRHTPDPSAGAEPYAVVVVGRVAYYAASDPRHGEEPWSLTAAGHKLFFSAGWLWVSDGTAEGTTPVPFPDGVPRYAWTIVGVGDRVFFFHPWYDYTAKVHHLELWTSDGTSAGTALVKDLVGSIPGPAAGAGPLLFFTAHTDAEGDELWRSDGTAEGTNLVKDIQPGPAGSRLAELTDVGGTLFFRADDGIHGDELWRSDGTEAGTVMVQDIRPGSQGSHPRAFGAVGSVLSLSADDGVHGAEPWWSDGTPDGAALLQDIAPGRASSAPDLFAFAGGRVYFSADDGVAGRELWTVDPAEIPGFPVR